MIGRRVRRKAAVGHRAPLQVHRVDLGAVRAHRVARLRPPAAGLLPLAARRVVRTVGPATPLHPTAGVRALSPETVGSIATDA